VAITKIKRIFDPSITVVIPAAGESKKITRVPKSLIDIGSEKLIERQIRIVRKMMPQAEILVVLGYCANEVYKYIPKNVRCIENSDYEVSNIGRSLDLAMKNITTNNMMILYGDLVFNEKAIAIPHEHSCIILNKKGKENSVGCNLEGNMVRHFTYASPNKWAEIALLTENEMSILRKLIHNKNSAKLLGFEVLNQVIDFGGSFQAYENHGPIIELDTNSDIINLNLLETLR